LISEDEDAAEKFLNEMSKIYRYMLRNEEDQLVPLEMELSFAESYFYLLNTRYSNALNLTIHVKEEDKHKLIPPLTLQVIIENAVAQNAFSKSAPLSLSICSCVQELEITHTVKRKIGAEYNDLAAGLDTLIEKYRVLHQSPLHIYEKEGARVITVPLIVEQEKVAS